MTQKAKAGDILLYDFTTLSSDLVTDGEEMADGQQAHEYNHIAVAISAREKIEADGHAVVINPIDYGDPALTIVTVSDDTAAIHAALTHIQKYLGQGYDWLEIVDQGLRDLSRGIMHLPKNLIMETEVHHKICSSLVQIFLADLGIEVTVGEGGDYASPEDCAIAIMNHLNPSQETVAEAPKTSGRRSRQVTQQTEQTVQQTEQTTTSTEEKTEDTTSTDTTEQTPSPDSEQTVQTADTQETVEPTVEPTTELDASQVTASTSEETTEETAQTDASTESSENGADQAPTV